MISRKWPTFRLSLRKGGSLQGPCVSERGSKFRALDELEGYLSAQMHPPGESDTFNVARLVWS